MSSLAPPVVAIDLGLQQSADGALEATAAYTSARTLMQT